MKILHVTIIVHLTVTTSLSPFITMATPNVPAILLQAKRAIRAYVGDRGESFRVGHGDKKRYNKMHCILASARSSPTTPWNLWKERIVQIQ